MRFLNRSIQARLIFWFLLVSFLTVGMVGLLAYTQARNALEDSIFARLEAVATLKEEAINRWYGDRRTDVILLARSPDIRGLTTPIIDPNQAALLSEGEREQIFSELEQILGDVVERRVDFDEFFIMDARNGTIVFSTDEERLGELVAEPYFLEGQNSTFLQPITQSKNGQPAVMTISTPLRTIEGELLGVFAAHVNPERLERIVLDNVGLGEGGETYLVDNENLRVKVINPFAQNLSENAEIVVSEGIEKALNEEHGRNLYVNYENIPVLGVYRWLDDIQLALLAEMPENEAFAPARQLGISISLIGALGAIALTIIIYVISSTISRPIVDLTKTAVRVSDGDLTATATILSEDEIGTLARTFNQMTEQLRRLYISLEAQVNSRTAELADRVQQLNLINQVSHSANVHLDESELLPEVVRLIRESFDFYAVGILLIDQQEENAFLSAADTAVDFDFDFHTYSIQLNQPGIITEVIKTGKPIVVNDLSQTKKFQTNSRLPNVKSELGLPLKVGAEVIGVLEIQHSEVQAFTPEDVQVLQTLSDQIAVSIRNAELYTAAEEARTDAEEANWMKSQFLANMSHELRTPLNAIINFAYLLSLKVDGPLSIEQEDMLNRIGDSGRHLLGLINDILDLAKIESGRIDLFLEKVYLPELIHGVMSTAVGLVRGKPIELNTEVPDDLALAQADRNRIRQVLLNLVSNAAKFTDIGHITIRATADDGGWITISVEDSGIGMREEDIPKAFSEFVQVDGEMDRRTGGTGLGLPITKKFIEMHGGQIWVNSTLGEGSTFYFTLPQFESGPVPPDTQHITKEVSPLTMMRGSNNE